MIYAVLSDIHCHAWSLYSTVEHDGVNSRLRLTLNEWLRAAKTLKAAGGRTMFISGDIFHERGKIDPEVLNPIRETVSEILEMDIDILAIPGNHDLKSNDSSMLSSSIENLAGISITGGSFRVFNEPAVVDIDGWKFAFVPWRSNHTALLDDLETLSRDSLANQFAVFIHAGIDGVISGTPGSGLTDKVLGNFGFHWVFAGHYHNHVMLEHGVVSVGATTHHNWGDVKTRAGFLIVDAKTDAVRFYDTMAPKFVDVSDLDETEMELECKGNYVRFRGDPMNQDAINELRKQFKDWGALGVSMEVAKSTAPTLRATGPAKGLSIKESVANYADTAKTVSPNVDRAELKRRAVEILEASQVVYEEV